MMFWLGSLLFRLIAPPDLSKVAGILRRARSLDNRAMDADEFARIDWLRHVQLVSGRQNANAIFWSRRSGGGDGGNEAVLYAGRDRGL